MPTTSPIFDHAPPPAAAEPDFARHSDAERLDRLEGEVGALRQAFTEFAGIVVTDIKKKRSAELELPPGAVAEPDANVRRPWLLLDLFREISTAVRMYFDPRYRVRRSTQLLVPAILALFVVSYLFFSVFPIPVLDKVLEKAADIVLAVLLYKVVQREVVRYRGVMAAFAAYEAAPPLPALVVPGDPESAPHTRLQTE